MDLEYATILDLAADNLRLGRPVVLDAPFGRYFSQPDYLAEVTYRHDWPSDVELVVVQVRVDKDTARERVRARGCARDLSKLADWDTFWKTAEANECQWADGRMAGVRQPRRRRDGGRGRPRAGGTGPTGPLSRLGEPDRPGP